MEKEFKSGDSKWRRSSRAVIRRAIPDAKAVKVEDLTQARKLDGNERRLGYEMRRMVEMARWG